MTGFQLRLQSLKAQYLLAASKTEMLLVSRLQIMYKMGLREGLEDKISIRLIIYNYILPVNLKIPLAAIKKKIKKKEYEETDF